MKWIFIFSEVFFRVDFNISFSANKKNFKTLQSSPHARLLKFLVLFSPQTKSWLTNCTSFVPYVCCIFNLSLYRCVNFTSFIFFQLNMSQDEKRLSFFILLLFWWCLKWNFLNQTRLRSIHRERMKRRQLKMNLFS